MKNYMLHSTGKKNYKKCYIVGACPSSVVSLISKNENDIIIAADGGYDLLKEKSLEADILIGDFDSIDKIPAHGNIIRYPAEKDDTDTFIAYKTAYDAGYRNFLIYGGTGGRIDHTISNIQTLINMSENGARGFLFGDDFIITAITNTGISFPEKMSGTVSVFSFEKVCGVTIEGLKYCVKDYTITPDYPIGVSNSFTEKNAVISVDNGTLVIIWYDSAENFENYCEKLFL